MVAGSPGNGRPAPPTSRSRRSTSPPTPICVVAGLLHAGLAGLRDGAVLPEPVGVDPASLSDRRGGSAASSRCRASLADVADAFEADAVLTAAFGTELAATIVDVRRAEVDLFADAKPEDIAAAVRWRH